MSYIAHPLPLRSVALNKKSSPKIKETSIEIATVPLSVRPTVPLSVQLLNYKLTYFGSRCYRSQTTTLFFQPAEEAETEAETEAEAEEAATVEAAPKG